LTTLVPREVRRRTLNTPYRATGLSILDQAWS
jgi:hypothetical protein